MHINVVEGGKKFWLCRSGSSFLRGPDQDNRSSVHENRFRFYYNTPKQLALLYRKENLDQLPRDTPWHTVLAVLAKTQKELKGGTPRVYPSQNAADLLELVRDGKETVFCAQYCYLTVQFLQSLGFYARYVTIIGYEVCEVWLPDEKQWVALDPTNGIYYVDAQGKNFPSSKSPSLKKQKRHVGHASRRIAHLPLQD